MRSGARWLLVGVLLGCSGEARLNLRLEGAQRAELDPLTDPRMTQLRLVNDRTGHALGETTVLPSQEHSIGSFLPATLDLRVEGLSQAGLLLAVGRTRSVHLTTEGTHSIEVALRKPLGLVLGDASVEMVDTSASTDQGLAMPIAAARAIATTNDGRALLFASDNALVRVSTSTLTEEARGDLGGPASALVVDPRDRTVAALLPDRVVLLGLDAIGQTMGEIGPPIAEIAAPLAAAFSGDGERLHVVSGALPACAGGGQNLVTIDRASGATAATVTLDVPVADVAVHAGTGRVLLAAPCAGKVLTIDPAGGPTQDLFASPGASDLAVVGDAIIVAGDAALQGPASLTLGDLVANTASQVAWDPPHFAGTFSDPRASSRADLLAAATRLHAHDVALSADGRRALLQATLDYQATFPAVTPGNGFTCKGILEATSSGVWGVDLSTGATWLERRAQESVRTCKLMCTLDVLPVPFEITCMGRGVPQPFQPRGTTFLFGGT